MTREHFQIRRYAVLDSTNSEAIRWARAGFKVPSVFVADTQTEGRGQFGRKWESPPGKNLTLSFLFFPESKPAEVASLTGDAALAVKEVLEGVRGGIFAIKWPNDLLLNGKKVAGILTETASEGEKILWAVCGIGINVNTGPEDFSPALITTATSLKIEFGMEFDREAILEDVIEKISEWYEEAKLGN